ncbi:MAG: DUF11 domain-containing protein [Clostridia bacterium]|nr:DUF11 domain-containing protein [Clostridia bacterium]
MPQTITNQATLNFEYNGQQGQAVSNIATATLTEPLTVSKNSVEQAYRAGDTLTFAVNFINSGTAALNNVTVTDDLGAGTAAAAPFTFVSPALLFIDGVYNGPITPTQTESGLSFTIPTLAAGSNAQILYTVDTNEYTPLSGGSQIINTVTVTADGLATPVTDSNTVTVDEYANVVITKNMAPANVVDGSTITYTFTISNYGNTEATNIVLSDAFTPAPMPISVQVDGVLIPATEYSYVDGVLTLPEGGTYTLSLPPATITQDAETGAVTITPSSTVITVTGTL